MDDIDNALVSRKKFTTLQNKLQEIMLLLGGMGPHPVAPTTVDPPHPCPFMVDPTQANTSIGLLPTALPHATREVKQPAHLTLPMDGINRYVEVAPSERLEDKLTSKILSLEKLMKAIGGTDHYGRTSFSELCLFVEVQYPPKIKIPDCT